MQKTALANSSKPIVVRGSVRELHEVISGRTCKGNVKDLLAAFPGESVFCCQKKQTVPLVLATALTPFHTGRIEKVDGHFICEVDCGCSCQGAVPFI